MGAPIGMSLCNNAEAIPERIRQPSYVAFTYIYRYVSIQVMAIVVLNYGHMHCFVLTSHEYLCVHTCTWHPQAWQLHEIKVL